MTVRTLPRPATVPERSAADALVAAARFGERSAAAPGRCPPDPRRQGQLIAGFHCAKTPAGLASATQAWRS
jgi:hypothetical protein